MAAQPRKALVLTAVCLGQFMIQLDLTIVNVALPSIGQDLGASVSGLQWVIDGYSLALASLLLLGGRIGDRSGHKRVYLAGLVIFAVGSGLCALAPSLGWLIGARILQGIGGAIELPATLAILTHTFTDQRERAQAVGIWAGAAGSSLVVGPVLGGALIAGFGWPAVFIVNLPIALVIGLFILATVTEAVEPDTGGLDVPGQLLGAAALGLLAGGAIEGGRQGFASGLALSLFAAGAASVAAFITVEHRRTDPMLPLAFFRRAAYSAANAVGLVMGFVTFGILFVFSLFFQQVHGDSAIAAGLRFLPLTIAFVIAGPLVGRVIDRVGHGAPMAVGCVLMGAGTLLLLLVNSGSGYGRVWWPFVIIGPWLRPDLHPDGRRRPGRRTQRTSRHGLLHQPRRASGRRRLRHRRPRRPAPHHQPHPRRRAGLRRDLHRRAAQRTHHRRRRSPRRRRAGGGIHPDTPRPGIRRCRPGLRARHRYRRRSRQCTLA